MSPGTTGLIQWFRASGHLIGVVVVGGGGGDDVDDDADVFSVWMF